MVPVEDGVGQGDHRLQPEALPRPEQKGFGALQAAVGVVGEVSPEPGQPLPQERVVPEQVVEAVGHRQGLGLVGVRSQGGIAAGQVGPGVVQDQPPRQAVRRLDGPVGAPVDTTLEAANGVGRQLDLAASDLAALQRPEILQRHPEAGQVVERGRHPQEPDVRGGLRLGGSNDLPEVAGEEVDGHVQPHGAHDGDLPLALRLGHPGDDAAAPQAFHRVGREPEPPVEHLLQLRRQSVALGGDQGHQQKPREPVERVGPTDGARGPRSRPAATGECRF